MNDNYQETQDAIRELAAEVRKSRQTMLFSFAIFSFLGGLVELLYHPLNVLFWAFFLAAATFFFWAVYARIEGIACAIREEVRQQHSQEGSLPVGEDASPPP